MLPRPTMPAALAVPETSDCILIFGWFCLFTRLSTTSVIRVARSWTAGSWIPSSLSKPKVPGFQVSGRITGRLYSSLSCISCGASVSTGLNSFEMDAGAGGCGGTANRCEVGPAAKREGRIAGDGKGGAALNVRGVCRSPCCGSASLLVSRGRCPPVSPGTVGTNMVDWLWTIPVCGKKRTRRGCLGIISPGDSETCSPMCNYIFQRQGESLFSLPCQ